MNKNLKKQLFDQSAHFVIGLILVVVYSFVFSILSSMLATFVIVYSREIFQRIDNGDPWYECKDGCKLDLLFWGLGIVVGSFVAVMWPNLVLPHINL